MDPISQGVVGATASQLTAKVGNQTNSNEHKLAVIVLGFLSGMAADLDVLIRSKTDPLLALEFHRQFTHSLLFIPIGALLCALVLRFLFFREKLSFKEAYIYCFAGYATHALLDACTTYGTQLFWPLSNMRVAWNNVSVVDPLFTLPLLALLLVSIVRGTKFWSIVSVVYLFSYLGLGVLQNQRASAIAIELANNRGHTPQKLGLKPSFANLLVWKSVYEYDGRYYVDAIRVGRASKIIEGSSTEKLILAKHFAWLEKNSQQALDVERFAWFSNQHLAIDPNNENRIIDIRYSLIPNRMDGMWGIELDENANKDAHVKWTTTRPKPSEMGQWLDRFWAMIKG